MGGGRPLRAPYAHPAELGRRTWSITYAMPLHVSTGPTETVALLQAASTICSSARSVSPGRRVVIRSSVASSSMSGLTWYLRTSVTSGRDELRSASPVVLRAAKRLSNAASVGANAMRPAASSPSSGATRPSAPVAAQPITPPPSSRTIIETAAAPTEAEIIASGKGKFAWPLRGEILSSFGIKGTGQRNDGLNIRAPQGTPVLSSADGEIAYAGNQVPTFGNLVLVKHADGWVTAYAHLSSTSVKMRQQVKQGEQLGTVGATGGVNEPQLHFEMRYAPTAKDKAKPVDPALVLPR